MYRLGIHLDLCFRFLDTRLALGDTLGATFKRGDRFKNVIAFLFQVG